MLRTAKGWIKDAAAKIGLELRQNANIDPYLVQRRLTPTREPVIFDVGAYDGQTSLRYRRLFPHARLYAFEPFPPSYAKLERALAWDSNVRIRQVALAAGPGRARLHTNPAPATNSLLPTEASAADVWGSGVLESTEQVEVQTDTIDGICERESVAAIDILKLDVQGGELAVLQGATSTLSSSRIGLVYLEMLIAPTYGGQHHPYEYLQLMAQFGYRWVDVFNPMRRRGRLLQFDVLFAAPSRL